MSWFKFAKFKALISVQMLGQATLAVFPAVICHLVNLAVLSLEWNELRDLPAMYAYVDCWQTSTSRATNLQKSSMFFPAQKESQTKKTQYSLLTASLLTAMLSIQSSSPCHVAHSNCGLG